MAIFFKRSLLLFGSFMMVLGFAASPVFAHTEECEEFLKKLSSVAATYGWVNVPENWDQPQGKQIQVFYYGYFSYSEKSDLVPIVYFNGGPGYAVHGLYEYYIAPSRPMYAKLPFLFLDQRGMGCSTPLPVVKTNAEGLKQIGHYGMRSIVKDAEAVRKQVFHGRPWRIFGQSYGSIIVHRYLELYPESVTAAFAHGASVMTDGIDWVIERIRAFKRVGDAYLKEYPEDAEKLQVAREFFPKDYCQYEGFNKSCGSGILDQLGWQHLSYKSYGNWEYLHKVIGTLVESNPAGKSFLNLHQIPSFISPKVAEDVTDTEKMGYLLVDVAPAREGPGGMTNTWSCEKAHKKMIQMGEDPMSYDFNECRWMLAAERSYDYSLLDEMIEQDPISLKTIQKNLKKFPQLKFFLYSEELDTFGPQTAFEEEVNLFGSRIQYREFPNGHGDYFNEKQIYFDLISTEARQ